MQSEIYHGRVLELAGNISHCQRLDHADVSATKVSRICGSTLTLDLEVDGNTITNIGMELKACALGQAAAAILSENAIGATFREVIDARHQMHAMLKDGAKPPKGRFWELRHLQGVRNYPPRHVSTMLAFDAAAAAIESLRNNRHHTSGALKSNPEK